MTAIDAMFQQPAVQAVGWALVQFLWQGALIGAATAVVLGALRRSAADIRYVVATIALSVMVTIPVVTAWQALQPEPPRAMAAAGERSRASSVVFAAVVPDRASIVPLEADAAAALPAPSIEPFLPALVTVWLAGVAMLTLRLFSGWLWVQRLRTHGAVPAAAVVHGCAARLLRQLHIGRPIRFLQSSLVEVPTVIGWLKPVVLLPASTLSGLTPQQLEAVLAHELAHIRRHDYLVNLLQTVVETLLFYHPAVWWLSRRIRIERENCCDDLAVSLCGDPLTYASALAEMEGMRGTHRQVALAATGGSLIQRVRRLLGAPSHAGRAPGWLAAGLAVLVIVAISAGAVGGDRVTAESESAAVLDDALEAPVEPAPPLPPAFSQPDAALDRGARRPRSLVSTEQAARRCLQWIEGELPNQLRGHAHSLRGPCQALANARQFLRTEPRRVARLARNAAKVAPVVAQAATEPIVQAAEAIAEASRASVAQVEPALADISRLIEAAQREAVAALEQAASGGSRGQKSGNVVWSNDGEKLEINYRGDVEFTDDDADLKSLTPGGWLRIRQETRSGQTRVLEYNAQADGTIQRRFRVGGGDRPFEPEGRKWAAEMLPRFIRQSGIGAANRVRRIYRAGGATAVLGETALIEGDHAKRRYYSELLHIPALGARDVERTLARAGTEIKSDFELASLLIGAGPLLDDEGARRAYVGAARSIESDFEMRRVFSGLLKNGAPAPALLAAVLDASASLDSDFEAASLLAGVATHQSIDATVRGPFFRALETVGSAFERRRVLAAVFDRDDLSAEAAVAALESASRVDSDFECATVLVQFVKRRPVEGAVRAPFFKAVASIDSAFERGRVLKEVARRTDVSSDTVLDVIRSAQGMNSGFERAQVLLLIAGSHDLTRESRDAYIDASEHLGDHEQGRVLAALVKNERRK